MLLGFRFYPYIRDVPHFKQKNSPILPFSQRMCGDLAINPPIRPQIKTPAIMRINIIIPIFNLLLIIHVRVNVFYFFPKYFSKDFYPRIN